MKNIFIPIDTGEIDLAIDRMGREWEPENQALIAAGAMRPYRVAALLRASLEAIARRHVAFAEPEAITYYDLLNLSVSDRVGSWLRAVGCAAVTIDDLERDAAARADPARWERLRAAMIEVALGFATSELIDLDAMARHEAGNAQALKVAAERGAKFSGGRQPGSHADHNRWLREYIADHPGKTSPEYRDMIRRLSGSPECPFEWDGEEDVLSKNLKAVNLLELVKAARKPSRNKAKSTSADARGQKR